VVAVQVPCDEKYFPTSVVVKIYFFSPTSDYKNSLTFHAVPFTVHFVKETYQVLRGSVIGGG